MGRTGILGARTVTDSSLRKPAAYRVKGRAGYKRLVLSRETKGHGVLIFAITCSFGILIIGLLNVVRQVSKLITVVELVEMFGSNAKRF